MAAAQANKVIPLYENYAEESNSRPTAVIAKEGTTGLAAEHNLKKSDIDLFLYLLETMRNVPEHLFDTISNIFSRLREPVTDFSADEIMPIEIENLPTVSAHQHQANMSYLDVLKAVLPETENDIEITALL